MSVRLGNPTVFVKAATAVAAVTSPSGNALVLTPAATNTAGYYILDSLFFSYVASGSAGNRVISVLVKDPSGNRLWQTRKSTALVASTTLNGYIASGVAFSEQTAPITYYDAIPFDFAIPYGGTISVIDVTAVDTADTVAVNAVLIY